MSGKPQTTTATHAARLRVISAPRIAEYSAHKHAAANGDLCRDDIATPGKYIGCPESRRACTHAKITAMDLHRRWRPRPVFAG